MLQFRSSKAHSLSKNFCTMILFSKNDSWCWLWLGWKGLVRMITFSKNEDCAELFTQWMGFNLLKVWKVILTSLFLRISEWNINFLFQCDGLSLSEVNVSTGIKLPVSCIFLWSKVVKDHSYLAIFDLNSFLVPHRLAL